MTKKLTNLQAVKIEASKLIDEQIDVVTEHAKKMGQMLAGDIDAKVMAKLLESVDNTVGALTQEHTVNDVQVDEQGIVYMEMTIKPHYPLDMMTVTFDLDREKDCPICRFEQLITELEAGEDAPDKPNKG